MFKDSEGVDKLGGNSTVSFNGVRTPRFDIFASATELRERLEALSTIGRYGVEVSRHDLSGLRFRGTSRSCREARHRS